jgi:GNAT superfamily N-acetyltransferase
MSVRIRPAQTADLDAVLKIAESRALTVTGEDPTAQGFLVSGFSREQYAELLERAEYFYVAVVADDDVVVGFVVAYGSERVKDDEWLNREMEVYFPEFTVIKQVATSPDHAGRGVGSLLYQRVLERNYVLHRSVPILLGPPGVVAQHTARLQRSPSALVLRALPFVAGIGWLVLTMIAGAAFPSSISDRDALPNRHGTPARRTGPTATG